MKLRFIVLILFAALGISTAFAGNIKITGRVLYADDSTSVTGATVCLMENNKMLSGTTTDNEGIFQLAANVKATAKVEISFVGFVPISIKIGKGKQNINIGDIYLVEDSKALNEVVVSGTKRQINRQLVFPDKLQVKASQDIMTLLQNLSLNGLSVDQINKSASIHGKPILWKVNGVPQSLTQIKNIDPKSILRIDYSEMPSIREIDRGYGGIVNIILKKRDNGGSVAAHLQSALWVGFVNAEVSTNYHNGRSDFSLNYNSSYRNYPKWQKQIEQRFIGDNTNIKYEELPEHSPFKYIDQNADLTYSYMPSEKSIFSASWRNMFGSQSSDIRNTIIQTGEDTFHRRSKSKYDSYVPSLDLYYQGTLKNEGKIEANLVGTVSTGKNKRDLEDKAGEKIISSISNPVNSDYYSLIGEITYEKSIHPKIYLSTGIQDRYIYTSNNYLSEEGYLDKLYQNNAYLFGQLSGKLSRNLQYQAGTGLKLFSVKKDDESRSFVRNQTSLALYYFPIDELYISLYSNFSPFLPSLAQLSEVKQRFDKLSMYSGNKNLRSSYDLINMLNIGYRKDKFDTNLSLSYNYTSDPIYTSITYQPGEGYFLFKPENGKYNRRYGGELKMNYKNIGKILSLYGTAGWNRYESNVGDNPLHLNSFYWNISAQMTYKDFVLSMYYQNSEKNLYNETVSSTGNTTGLTLMWNKEKWILYAQVLYLGIKNGDTYTVTSYSKANPLKSKVKIPENGNMLTLGIVWNFNFGKQGKTIDRSLNNRDNNESVLKVQE